MDCQNVLLCTSPSSVRLPVVDIINRQTANRIVRTPNVTHSLGEIRRRRDSRFSCSKNIRSLHKSMHRQTKALDVANHTMLYISYRRTANRI
jgi:hypothetical protein